MFEVSLLLSFSSNLTLIISISSLLLRFVEVVGISHEFGTLGRCGIVVVSFGLETCTVWVLLFL